MHEGVHRWVAGGEGHHDGRFVSRAGPSPAQREGRALGSRLAIHARQHHRSLADLFSWCTESVCLQGELLALQLGALLLFVTVSFSKRARRPRQDMASCVFTCFLYSAIVWVRPSIEN